MIEVLSPGIFSSIQDLGRKHHRHLGVPVSGAMDSISAKLANQLVNNSTDAAVLEFAFCGPRLRFHSSTYIAITGADMLPTLNEMVVNQNQILAVNSGDVLRFSAARMGVHGYLAVWGGIQSPSILGSRSQYQNITASHKLIKNETLKILKAPQQSVVNRTSIKPHPGLFEDHTIKAFAGPEFGLLTPEEQARLLNSLFKISPQSHRMAFGFQQKLPHRTQGIITSAVQPGTVQLTPAGDLMALMRDAQTTGGYARILQLTEKSINKLAQRRAGMKVRFQLIETEI